MISPMKGGEGMGKEKKPKKETKKPKKGAKK